MLSDVQIKRMVEQGWLVDKMAVNALQPASIDCTLGRKFLFVDESVGVVDMNEKIQYRCIEADSVIVPALSFVLATTNETVKLPRDVSAYVEGRSSIARMGLTVQTAGFIDPGFEGKITLELFNANRVPLRLHAGRRICQLVFFNLAIAAESAYTGKYQKQDDVTGSRINLDEELNGKF